jgi:SagB-type dehydrogenase family enzyme
MAPKAVEPAWSKVFHQSSQDHLKGHPPIPADSRDWPEEWLTTYYKTYPRLPKIPLSDERPAADFFELASRRASRRDFTREPVSKREVSILLRYACGVAGALEDGRARRAHPSGGARFPIESYPIVLKAADNLPAGLYHYAVKAHALDVLWQRPFADEQVDGLFMYPWVKDAAVAIVLTAVFWRAQRKYGERGYRYVLLEAGHIGQNLSLICAALGLSCCALGGTRDEAVEKLLDIDGVTESVVYAVAIGK